MLLIQSVPKRATQARRYQDILITNAYLSLETLVVDQTIVHIVIFNVKGIGDSQKTRVARSSNASKTPERTHCQNMRRRHATAHHKEKQSTVRNVG